MATTNPDPKRPRLDSWGGGTSSPQSHVMHLNHPQPQLPYMSSPTGLGNWDLQTTPPSQHTLSRSRAHSTPTSNQGVLSVGGHGHPSSSHPVEHYIGNSHPVGIAGRPLSRNPHAHTNANNSSSGQNVLNTGFNTYHPSANPNPQISSSNDVATSPTTPSSAAGTSPHSRTLSEQHQLQQLRPLSVPGNSQSAHFHPNSSYYGQQQQQHSMSGSMGDSRGHIGHPIKRSPSASSQSPQTATGGFAGASVMNHSALQGNSGGATTSPIMTIPISAGPGGMSAAVQAMGVVTTYPPRRKAIRAAQACDACRARKAKCDEGRPSCGFCKESQNPCVYREVPPPKQDRTLLQILDRLCRVETLLDSFNSGRSMEAASGEASGNPAAASTIGTNKHQNASSVAEPTPSILQRTTPPLYIPSTSQLNPVGATASHGIGNPTEVPLEEDEQLTIPYQHTTAAHKLLWWRSIRKLIDDDFLADDAYVLKDAEKQGTMRIFGRGESSLVTDSFFSENSDENTPVEAGGSFIDGWGTFGAHGMEWDSGIGVNEESGDGLGWYINEASSPVDHESHPRKIAEGSGLTTGGGLKLDHHTVVKLLNSYLANIHILHPILDKSTITKMAFMFADRVLSTPPQPASPAMNYSSPSAGLGLSGNGNGNGTMQAGVLHKRNSTNATKRKRSMSIPQSQTTPTSGNSGKPSPQRIPKNVHSALVLLVLALGAVCLHRRPVPGPLPRSAVSPDFNNSTPPMGISTPPSFTASTPPSYHSPYSQRSRGRTREMRNVDVIPGLAYFAKATEILGALAGSNELENVQAGLLAGLYWGQLGRVLDSWKWISSACMGCQILVRIKLQHETERLRKDLILRAFWSCLQLESDVLAELDLPPSGISRLEDSMMLPSAVALPSLDSEAKEDDPLMWMYYLAQIALRKLLNRVHTALYKNKGSLDSPRSLAIARELDYQLEQWKLHLPDALQWKECDPPATDINAARLRAKYWGARYIIHRPFIYHVLHPGISSPTLSNCEVSQHGSPNGSVISVGGGSAFGTRRISATGEDRIDLDTSCRKCLESAVHSTTSFHAFSPDDNRPIITNVFGTAHAQFGNLLVLQAAYQSPSLKNMISPQTLRDLINKTVHWLHTLAPISDALRKDAAILENAASKLDFKLHSDTY
ncbi:hypothetical protein RUND412_004639 [Rhizina undulata]